MKKVILTYGLISGAIVSGLMLVSQPLLKDGTINYDHGMLIGYASMVIALSLVFFGIKTYRDQYSNGTISFGQGFKIGITITLIASVMYALSWEVYYNTAGGDFIEQYTQHYIGKLQKDGASAAEITEAKQEMADFNELYKNPVIRFGITLTEILPVGIIITLLSAALLRKRQILPV